MKTSTLQEIAASVTVSKDAQTILFIDRAGIKQSQAERLSQLLSARLGADKVIIVLTYGNPNFIVKPVAIKQDGKVE